MKTFNKILIAIIYILIIAIFVRLGFLTAVVRMLMMRTSSGATYLQVVIMLAALIGVLGLWAGMIKEGLKGES